MTRSPFRRLGRLVRDRARRTDAGMSLVEISIVCGLLAIIMPVAFMSLVSVQRTEASTTSRFAALSEAQVMAGRMSRDIRTAVAPSPTAAAFTLADQQEMTFYANLGGAQPSVLHFYISVLPGTAVAILHEDVTPSGGTTAPRIVGKFVDTTKPIFSFMKKDGTVLTAPVAASQLANIEQVGITLVTHEKPTSPASTITTTIHIRNVDYNPSGP